MNNKKYKLSHWMKIFWGILFLCVLALFVFFVAHLKKIQTKQVTENLQDSMSIYIDEIDTSFNSTDKYLYLTLANSTDVVRLESEKKELAYYISVQNIQSTMSKILGFNDNICEIAYLYPGKVNSKSITVSSVGGIAKRDELDSILLGRLEDQKGNKDYLVGKYDFCNIGDSVYLVHYYKINHSYFAIAMSTNVIFKELSKLHEKEGTELFLTSDDGTIIDATAKIETKLSPDSNGKIISVNKNEYLMSEGKSMEGHFYIGLLSKKDIINKSSNQIAQIILVLFLILIAIYFPGNMMFVNYFILKPISNLVKSMQQLGNGKLGIRINANSKIQEYYVLEDAFNDMSVEIKDLKIQNYETAIKKKNAELQYLQLQISPHFYLNALNVIYSLAQIKDYQKIQKMTMHLVNYSRYMFHNAQELVALEEELKHVKEYIEIQEMRMGNFEGYHEDVEEQLKRLLIPPFAIQGFVENSVKYAIRNSNSKSNKLVISGKYDSQSHMVILKVQDGGEGYSQSVLDNINSGNNVEKDSEKNIGIRNVIERLQIIYGNKAEVRVYNDNGAVAELRVPLILKD